MSLWVCPKCGVLFGPTHGICQTCGVATEYATLGSFTPAPDLRARYRLAATRIYGGHGLTIPAYGNVTPMADGGAFVEAVVWVSEESLRAIESQCDA